MQVCVPQGRTPACMQVCDPPDDVPTDARMQVCNTLVFRASSWNGPKPPHSLVRRPAFTERSRSILSGDAPRGAVLGAPWTILGASGAVLGPSWEPLGASWGDLGGLYGHLGRFENKTTLQTYVNVYAFPEN